MADNRARGEPVSFLQTGYAIAATFHSGSVSNSTNPLALPCRCDGDRQKIDGPLTLREVTRIDRPGLFGGKTERRDNRGAFRRYQDFRMTHRI